MPEVLIKQLMHAISFENFSKREFVLNDISDKNKDTDYECIYFYFVGANQTRIEVIYYYLFFSL